MSTEQAVRFVYKFWDSQSRVLYVGMSQDVYKRVRQHARTFPYWADVRTIEVYVYPWGVAPGAEQWFIRVDSPLHNGSRPGASYPVEHPGDAVREFLFEGSGTEIANRPTTWFWGAFREAELDEFNGTCLSRRTPDWALL
jgi:hypothetical protein